MTDSEIDFVPEDNEWIPETSPEFWEPEEDEDMEETMVLEVVEPYEESREPYSKYGKDPYANL